MKIETRQIDKIIPYVANPREISKQAIDKVASSLKEFGWRQPIVVDSEGVIIVGHTRLLAAKKLGLKEVPIHIADNLTKAQIKAYRIADNKTGEYSEWNVDFLDTELSALEDMDFDLGLTGFDEDEINKILSQVENEGLTDDDEAPEVLDVAKSKRGEIWILGDHRVMCGDSCNESDVKKLLNGSLADMIFMDPPYNIDFTGSIQGDGTLANNSKFKKIANDKMSPEKWEEFLNGFISNAFKFNKGAFYICMSAQELHSLARVFKEQGGHWSSYIIWKKNNFTLSQRDYNSKYEPMLYGWHKKAKRYWCKNKSECDIWEIDRVKVSDLHPTMKPVDLVVRAIKNSSKCRDTVLDLFGGSGTTLIASEKLERHARLMELEPVYVDVIIKRWQGYTGKKAVRESDGIEFDGVVMVEKSE